MIELEELSAFLDGELPRDRAQLIAEEVARNRELRGQLQEYVKQLVEISSLHKPVMEDPVPQKLLDVLRKAENRGTKFRR